MPENTSAGGRPRKCESFAWTAIGRWRRRDGLGVNILWSTLGDGTSSANMPGAADAARSGVSRRSTGSG